jgi:hypothetical protein
MHAPRNPTRPDGVYPCVFEGAEAFLIWWQGQEGCLRWAKRSEAREALAMLRDRTLVPAKRRQRARLLLDRAA